MSDLGDKGAGVKIIFNGEPEDAVEAVQLILKELPSFERPDSKSGWGWGYRLSSGRHYFLRKIVGGVSASLCRAHTKENANG